MCQEESSNSRGWINQRTWTRGPYLAKQLEAKSSLQGQQSGLEGGRAGRDQGPAAIEREVQVGAHAVSLQLLIVAKGRGTKMSR